MKCTNQIHPCVQVVSKLRQTGYKYIRYHIVCMIVDWLPSILSFLYFFPNKMLLCISYIFDMWYIILSSIYVCISVFQNQFVELLGVAQWYYLCRVTAMRNWPVFQQLRRPILPFWHVWIPIFLAEMSCYSFENTFKSFRLYKNAMWNDMFCE